MRYCNRCLLPETHDTIMFDDEGVCSVCRQIEYRDEEIDWDAVEERLAFSENGVVLAITQSELDKMDVVIRDRLMPIVTERQIEGYNYVKGYQITLWLSKHTHDLK